MYIKDTGNTIKRTEKAFTLAQMVVDLKVTGLTMLKKVSDRNNGKTGRVIKDTFITIRKKDMVCM
jgi:hypothetical protein